MRRRILLATLLITTTTLLVFGIPLAWALGRVYRSEELSRLQQAATLAASAVPAEGLHGSDPIEPPAVPFGVALAYYDDRGLLVAGSGPSVADALAGAALDGRPREGTNGSRMISAHPITVNEATVGTVEASSSLSALAGRSRRAWLEMLVLGGAALGAAALFALWQARRLARPVDDLIAAAARLGDGDFTVSTRPSGVAEVDRAGEALASTSGRLRELLERERSFTAHASHQLRTPLTGLRLSLENALITPGVDVEQALRDAVTEADRLQDTLDQLFMLARSGTASALALAMPTVAVGEVLDDLERRWHPILAERGRRFEVRRDGTVAARRGPTTLGQILDILVDNATTHGRGSVEVAASAVSGGISIGVHDEGDGMVAIPAVAPLEMSAPRGSVGHAAAAVAGGPVAGGPAAGGPAAGGPVTAGAHGAHGAHDGHGLGLRLAQSLAEAAGGRLVLKSSGPGPLVAVILP
ncbi:MAG: hypothetical protein QOG97_3518 [Acidimicrobiaceae bacterium]|nr:hypothetical protein [Acidimicrobiaceae bacterium]